MKTRKIFAGAKLRALRERHRLTQGQMAARLQVSTSYVNQIENNQRPLTASLLLGLAREFSLDPTELMDANADRLLADLNEAMADPVFGDDPPGLVELKSITANAPSFARSLLNLYQAYKKTSEQLAGADEGMNFGNAGALQTPYEEVRDFFHYADNYIDPLDRAAETLATELDGEQYDYNTGIERLGRLADYLERTHDMKIAHVPAANPQMLREFEPSGRTLFLNNRLEPSTCFFQMANQLALMEQTTTINEILQQADFKSDEARRICHIGLANYFAGALLLPYGAFGRAARQNGHDLEQLAYRFGASLEQVAHRLSTMQRPGDPGIPFFFARVDAAGTITKRHSATPLQFARFGGACPLWNVHLAFEANGKIIRQLAQTPDKNRYLCLAWSRERRLGGYDGPLRRYAYALGCEISHAGKLVYARDLYLDSDPGLQEHIKFDPIGISCRTCERRNCAQRSVPPIAASISVATNRRSIIPYDIN